MVLYCQEPFPINRTRPTNPSGSLAFVHSRSTTRQIVEIHSVQLFLTLGSPVGCIVQQMVFGAAHSPLSSSRPRNRLITVRPSTPTVFTRVNTEWSLSLPMSPNQKKRGNQKWIMLVFVHTLCTCFVGANEKCRNYVNGGNATLLMTNSFMII